MQGRHPLQQATRTCSHSSDTEPMLSVRHSSPRRGIAAAISPSMGAVQLQQHQGGKAGTTSVVHCNEHPLKKLLGQQTRRANRQHQREQGRKPPSTAAPHPIPEQMCNVRSAVSAVAAPQGDTRGCSWGSLSDGKCTSRAVSCWEPGAGQCRAGRRQACQRMGGMPPHGGELQVMSVQDF